LIEPILVKRAEILKAIAHPVRLQILRNLCVKKENVTSLYTNIGLPQSTISRHLSVLKNAKVVKNNRKGLEIEYEFDCDQMEKFIKEIINY